MTFEDIEVASPAGCTEMLDRNAVSSRASVVVTGGRGAGKTLFFRAIAGLWPWGSGRIGSPAGGVTFRSALALFSTRLATDALSYPVSSEAYPDADLAAVLEKVGLGRFAGALDRVAAMGSRTQRRGPAPARFRAAWAPQARWVVIDEALDEIKGDARRRIMTMLEKDLAGATIISIGHADRDHFFTRELKLAIDPDRRS